MTTCAWCDGERGGEWVHVARVTTYDVDRRTGARVKTAESVTPPGDVCNECWEGASRIPAVVASLPEFWQDLPEPA